jgi:hypothetical protein
LLLRLEKAGGRDSRHPTRDDEVGLERIDRGSQWLQHIAAQQRRLAHQVRDDAGEQLPFAEAILNQPRMDIDGPLQSRVVQRDVLIVDPIGDEPRKGHADQRNQTDENT